MLGYLGRARALSTLLDDPPHSLLVQSYKAKELEGAVVNADGWGAAWYAAEELGAEHLAVVYAEYPPIQTAARDYGVESIGGKTVYRSGGARMIQYANELASKHFVGTMGPKGQFTADLDPVSREPQCKASDELSCSAAKAEVRRWSSNLDTLRQLGPEATLQRGYVLLKRANDGQLLMRASALAPNQALIARFADGERRLHSDDRSGLDEP